MFYYYLGAITFALVITLAITRLIDTLEHPASANIDDKQPLYF